MFQTNYFEVIWKYNGCYLGGPVDRPVSLSLLSINYMRLPMEASRTLNSINYIACTGYRT